MIYYHPTTFPKDHGKLAVHAVPDGKDRSLCGRWTTEKIPEFATYAKAWSSSRGEVTCQRCRKLAGQLVVV